MKSLLVAFVVLTQILCLISSQPVQNGNRPSCNLLNPKSWNKVKFSKSTHEQWLWSCIDFQFQAMKSMNFNEKSFCHCSYSAFNKFTYSTLNQFSNWMCHSFTRFSEPSMPRWPTAWWNQSMPCFVPHLLLRSIDQ